MIKNYDAYATAYGDFAGTCDQKDLDDWYNFRGLGGLRPSWLESNYSDRILKRMIKSCKAPTAEWQAACDEFNADRLAFRDKENTAMYLRQMMYDIRPEAKIGDQSDEQFFRNPQNPGVFVRDRDGDGIAEWIAPGPLTLVPGTSWKMDSGLRVTVSDDGKNLVGDNGTTLKIASATLAIVRTGEFSGDMVGTFKLADGSIVKSKVTPRVVQPITRTDTRWNKDLVKRKDVGLMEVFSDSTGCSGDSATPDTCPILARFHSMIDRHEDFYQTYSAVDPDFTGASSQPSPLVACSITLNAANEWSSAGTPPGGVAGFVYLMRIPFHAILSADARSIDTLGRLRGGLNAGPKVATLQEIYATDRAGREDLLDMSRLWVDIATLSSNEFASEHEVSKIGSVPAEQIEGLLVVRRPAAMSQP